MSKTGAVSGRRITLSLKLYSMAGLALAAIIFMAIASLHFAEVTRRAALGLYSEGLLGAQTTLHLGLMIEQHRRLVEGAPADLDRMHLESKRQELRQLGERMATLVQPNASDRSWWRGPDMIFAHQIEADLANLSEYGDRVLTLAYDFVQNQAVEIAQGPYSHAANDAEASILAWRDARLQLLNADINDLSHSARSMAWQVGIFFGIWLSLALLGLGITRGVIRRLRRITHSMLRLAASDTAIDIPSLTDRDEVGEMARAVKVFRNTALEVLEQQAELERTNRLFHAALSNMAQGLCMYDACDTLMVVNGRFSELFGLPPASVVPGMSFRDVLGMGEALGQLEDFRGPGAGAGDGLCGIKHQSLDNGRVIAIAQKSMPEGGWVATFEDVTQQRESEARIAYMATHDELTQLPNRTVFRERLTRVLSKSAGGSVHAVLYLDLDGFKAINDTLGHQSGDELLICVAKRLQSCVGELDTVARLGGDEFAILQVDVEHPGKAARLVERLLEAIERPYQLGGNQVVIGTSVGIALVPDDGQDPDELLTNADTALYRAKAEGRGTYRFFEKEMHDGLHARRTLERDLRQAVVDRNMLLHFQPVIDLETGLISSCEALLRWQHPIRGMIRPDEFIPVAEETGLIVPIGNWVLQTACRIAARWPYTIGIAVNISPIQFTRGDLVRAVAEALADSGLSPQRLELEITETVLLQDCATTVKILHELRALGVRIAMDDFGTGYSSLGYLRSFAFDRIKIDQSFIREIVGSDDAMAIVRAITGLAGSLGIATTAEGIERQDQLAAIRQEGCTDAQGYLFAVPMSAEDIELLLNSQTGARKPSGTHFAGEKVNA
jgi:diguanylate cyclase (GGDEF)-like protein